MQLVDWETRLLFGRSPRVYTWWSCVEPPHDGVRLLRAYRVVALSGRPRRRGAFRVSYNGDLWREYTTLLGETERRPDRVAWSRLHGCVVAAEVGTVERGAQQEELARGAQYSVIRRLVEVAAGAPQ